MAHQASPPQHHEAHHTPAPHPAAHHEAHHNGPPARHAVPHMNSPRMAVHHRGGSGYHRGGHGGRGSYAYHRRSRYAHPRRYPVKPNPETLLARARLQKLGKLKADLEGVKPNLTVTQGQRTRLAGDLMDIAEGPSKISPVPVKQLATSLADSLGRRTRATFDSEAMALYLRELMNSAGTAHSQFKPAIARGETLLHSAGIDKGDARDIAGNMQAVLAAFNPSEQGDNLK